MRLTLKPLDEQVMVITGASSGIGLVTAAGRPARADVVLAARNEKDLPTPPSRFGAPAVARSSWLPTSRMPAQVEAIAETALREFGRIDTWVNNAAVSMYGRSPSCRRGPRRQMDVNYWGQVHGSRAAVASPAASGGALSTSAVPCPTAPSLAGRLLCGETCAQGVYRCAPNGARGARRPDRRDTGETCQHRHAVLREARTTFASRAATSTAGVCAGSRV